MRDYLRTARGLYFFVNDKVAEIGTGSVGSHVRVFATLTTEFFPKRIAYFGFFASDCADSVNVASNWSAAGGSGSSRVPPKSRRVSFESSMEMAAASVSLFGSG